MDPWLNIDYSTPRRVEGSQIWALFTVLRFSTTPAVMEQLPGRPEEPDDTERSQQGATACLDWLTQDLLPDLVREQPTYAQQPVRKAPAMTDVPMSVLIGTLGDMAIRFNDALLAELCYDIVFLTDAPRRLELTTRTHRARAFTLAYHAACDCRDGNYENAIGRVSAVAPAYPEHSGKLLERLLNALVEEVAAPDLSTK